MTSRRRPPQTIAFPGVDAGRFARRWRRRPRRRDAFDFLDFHEAVAEADQIFAAQAIFAQIFSMPSFLKSSGKSSNAP